MNWLTVALIPPSGIQGSHEAPPPFAIALIVVVVLAFPALIVVMAILQNRRTRRARAANLASGVPMTARVMVLAKRGTGSVVPEGVFNVTLEIAHPRGPFVVVLPTIVAIPSLAQLQVGMTVPVRVAAADNVEITLAGVRHH